MLLSKIPERKARRSSQSNIRHSPLRTKSRRCVTKVKPRGTTSSQRRSVEREVEHGVPEEKKVFSPTSTHDGSMFSFTKHQNYKSKISRAADKVKVNAKPKSIMTERCQIEHETPRSIFQTTTEKRQSRQGLKKASGSTNKRNTKEPVVAVKISIGSVNSSAPKPKINQSKTFPQTA